MKAALALIIAVTLPLPALAQGTGEYDAAVAARTAGEPARAAALLEPIVAADPDNADAQVQLGLALLALDRLGEAERAFTAALAAAPDYADARIGLARIAQLRGRSAEAQAQLAAVPGDYPDAAELRRQLSQGSTAPRWAIDVDGSYSTLSGPQRDWAEAELRVRRLLSPHSAIGARIHVADRFGMTDTYGELLAELAASDALRGYIAAGGTPDADFLPQWQLSAGGSARLSGGSSATVLTLDLRQAQYRSGDVQTVTPGIEQYILGGRAWLTGRWINTFDETGDHRSGYLLRADAMASDAVRVFAGYSDASDSEAGIVSNVEAMFGGASVTLGNGTALRLSVAHENRAVGADRTQFAVGFGFGF